MGNEMGTRIAPVIPGAASALLTGGYFIQVCLFSYFLARSCYQLAGKVFHQIKPATNSRTATSFATGASAYTSGTRP
jgi:hypothetical protein